MTKKYFISFLIVLVAAAAIIVAIKSISEKKEVQDNNVSINDYKNATYIIEKQPITLADGVSETESTQDSAIKIVTRYFGNEIKHDLNDDGREDVVFILTQQSGGTGTFYYAVAALNTPTGYVGSEGYFLGDRILPQSIAINEGTTTQGTTRKNVIVVNYKTRGINEPFNAQPTEDWRVWIKLDSDTMKFADVALDFEGESR